MALTLSERYELLAGAVSYRALAHGAAPWLVGELVATEWARQRLRAWAEAGGLTRSAAIGPRLVFLGDEPIRAVVVRALDQIAPPARDAVVDHAWIVGVGRLANGWLSPAPPVPEPRDEALRLITLSGHLGDEDLAGVFAHEAAHHFLLPNCPPADVPSLSARRERRQQLVGLAAEWALVPTLIGRALRDEREAAALARAWGFTGPAADGDTCARGARQRVRAEVGAATQSPNGPVKGDGR